MIHAGWRPDRPGLLHIYRTACARPRHAKIFRTPGRPGRGGKNRPENMVVAESVKND